MLILPSFTLKAASTTHLESGAKLAMDSETTDLLNFVNNRLMEYMQSRDVTPGAIVIIRVSLQKPDGLDLPEAMWNTFRRLKLTTTGGKSMQKFLSSYGGNIIRGHKYGQAELSLVDGQLPMDALLGREEEGQRPTRRAKETAADKIQKVYKGDKN
mgnify:CR=1 FL=1